MISTFLLKLEWWLNIFWSINIITEGYLTVSNSIWWQLPVWWDNTNNIWANPCISLIYQNCSEHFWGTEDISRHTYRSFKSPILSVGFPSINISWYYLGKHVNTINILLKLAWRTVAGLHPSEMLMIMITLIVPARNLSGRVIVRPLTPTRICWSIRSILKGPIKLMILSSNSLWRGKIRLPIINLEVYKNQELKLKSLPKGYLQ